MRQRDTEEVLDICERTLSLPLHNDVESLNVTATAAVISISSQAVRRRIETRLDFSPERSVRRIFNFDVSVLKDVTNSVRSSKILEALAASRSDTNESISSSESTVSFERPRTRAARYSCQGH